MGRAPRNLRIRPFRGGRRVEFFVGREDTVSGLEHPSRRLVRASSFYDGFYRVPRPESGIETTFPVRTFSR